MLTRHDIRPLLLATVTFPAFHPLAGQTGVVNAFAVRHPRGLVLIDTGIGYGHADIDQLYQPIRQTVVDALGAHQLQVRDVVAVINTHLHFDHCGQNQRLPGVPIYVQRVEYEAAHQPGFTIADWVDFPGATYEHLDGEAELLPNITAVPTPGHTPGHQSVIVEAEDGRVLLAGQAIYSVEEYEHLSRTGEPLGGSAPADEDAYRASARRLLTYAPSRVHFSHDAATWGDDR